MPLYALTVFVSAFLLFQVQPLIARYILPWFGGGPAVWTASMLFFQMLLLAGYAYAHLSIVRLKARTQVTVHLVLLAAALTQLPITPSDALKPTEVAHPTAQILLLLTVSIGLPYLVLSSTAPLLQAWFARALPGRSPYRLYALSNLGSLLALVSYPVAVEPFLTRSTQTLVWSATFCLFVVLCGASAWWGLKAVGPEGAEAAAVPDPDEPPPAAGTRLLWLALSACAAVLFLAVTNQITMDVAVIPFLWVLPLSLYLLTFVIAFEHDGWYVRSWFGAALVPALVGAVWFMFRGESAPIPQQLVAYAAVVFIGCMVCHGELSRLKPHPRYLTAFYLTVALGGALGGVFVALLAPMIFNDHLELHVALLGVATLALVTMFIDEESTLFFGRRPAVWLVLAFSVAGLALALNFHAREAGELAVVRSRTFYGVLTVYLEDEGGREERLSLWHGRIPHGVQFTSPQLRGLGTGYYASNSGAAQAFRLLAPDRDRRIGMVGMGVGTLATYAEPGDYIRLYEINPEVRILSDTLFTYLGDSPAEIEVVMGDARLSMERDEAQDFDLLLLDAFSGDAIPLHLLTKEAFEVYDRHLAPGGVIALLISTWHLDFEPVVRRLASHFGRAGRSHRTVLPQAVLLLHRRGRDGLSARLPQRSPADLARAVPLPKDRSGPRHISVRRKRAHRRVLDEVRPRPVAAEGPVSLPERGLSAHVRLRGDLSRVVRARSDHPERESAGASAGHGSGRRHTAARTGEARGNPQHPTCRPGPDAGGFGDGSPHVHGHESPRFR